MTAPTDAFPWPALHGQDALDWLETQQGLEALKLYQAALARHLPNISLSYEVTAPCAYEDETESDRQFVIRLDAPLDDERWDLLLAVHNDVFAADEDIDRLLISVVCAK